MRNWLLSMGLLGTAGTVVGICAAIMLVGCGFGLYQSVKQAQRHAAFAEKCEAAGGVYRRGKYEAPACFRSDAFLPVTK
jgi:hypothetical protein